MPPSGASHPTCDHPCIRTTMGQAYNEVLHLKEFQKTARDHKQLLAADVGNGGDCDPIAVGALSVVAMNGGVVSVAGVEIADGVGILSKLPSLAVLNTFFSLIASSHFPDPSDTISLPMLECDLAFVLRATGSSSSSSPSSSRASHPFDLSKAPLSFSEAMAHPDASVWRAAMDHERQSLLDMGARRLIFHLGRRLLG